MVFSRSVIRARICKLFPRQLLSTLTPRGCVRDAQLVPSLFKLLKTSYSHQGPFLVQSPWVLEVSKTAGQAYVRKRGLWSASVCQCCRPLAAFLQAQPSLWLMPGPGWWLCSRSQDLFEREQDLHSVAGFIANPRLAPSAPAGTLHSQLFPLV